MELMKCLRKENSYNLKPKQKPCFIWHSILSNSHMLWQLKSRGSRSLYVHLCRQPPKNVIFWFFPCLPLISDYLGRNPPFPLIVVLTPCHFHCHLHPGFREEWFLLKNCNNLRSIHPSSLLYATKQQVVAKKKPHQHHDLHLYG